MPQNLFDNNSFPDSRPAPLSLSALTGILGDTIRRNPILQQVWVVAELSDVRASGHCYMELIEKDMLGRTVAKMRAQIWQGTFNSLSRKFYAATGSGISSGLKVMVCGSVTHHNIYGLSFNITDIDPSYTLGDMERIRKEILARLQAEGIINANKAVPFPVTPQKIAVISAAGAAGYGDFMNQIERNQDGFVFYPLLFQAVMQGERTAESVMDALDRIEQAFDFWDCVIIIRGGGATTDLNGFDNLELARRIATFPLPVIVGIGHERDRTVLDEIACVRCKTPTAVAEFLIDCLRVALSGVSSKIDSIVRKASDLLSGESRRLDNYKAMIPLLVEKCVADNVKKLERFSLIIPPCVSARIEKARTSLREISAAIPYMLSGRFSKEQQRLDHIASRVPPLAAAVSDKAARRLENLDNMVRLLSPQNTLNRGYSITRRHGKAITSAEDLSTGDIIETIFADGRVESAVRRGTES